MGQDAVALLLRLTEHAATRAAVLTPTHGALPCRTAAARRLLSLLPRPFVPHTTCTLHAVTLSSERGPRSVDLVVGV